ncbi:MAG: FG-GAP-like repeat-containing protein [Elusimicrobiota bacterium]
MKKRLFILATVVFIFSVLLLGVNSSYAVWTATGGGDHGGTDWIINTSSNVGGVHTNIKKFEIEASKEVFITTGSVFEVHADSIYVSGKLNGYASGQQGGAGGMNGYGGSVGYGYSSSTDVVNVGGGIGGDIPILGPNAAGAGGGSGGSYGGIGCAGGNGGKSTSSVEGTAILGGTGAVAGSVYGTVVSSIVYMGSGGGGGGAGGYGDYNTSSFYPGYAGGNGGACVILDGKYLVSISSEINVCGGNGLTGGSPVAGGGKGNQGNLVAGGGGGGSGGGSGGGLLLFSKNIILANSSVLKADGGTGSAGGGSGYAMTGNRLGGTGGIGGHGGGGRIKIVYGTTFTDLSASITYASGGVGASSGTYSVMVTPRVVYKYIGGYIAYPLVVHYSTGSIVIDYTLFSGSENVDLTLQYSCDGVNYYDCTPRNDSPGLTAKLGNPTGVDFQFIWDTASDFINRSLGTQQNIRLRMKPVAVNSTLIGEINESSQFSVAAPSTPSTINDLVVSKAAQVLLTWTAPSRYSDGTGGKVDKYIIEYSNTGELDESSWYSAGTVLPRVVVPSTPGIKEVLMLTGLDITKSYYFAVKSFNTYGLASSTSAISNSTGTMPSVFTISQVLEAEKGGYGKVILGDIDNDGDLDLLAAGGDVANTASFMLHYYLNNNGVFESKQWMDSDGSNPYGFAVASLDLGDYDRDGDLDLVVCGKNPGGFAKLYVYRFNGEWFQRALEPMGTGDGLVNGDVKFIDYDNDGDLDLLVAGGDLGSTGRLAMYQNNSSSYSLTTNVIPSEATGFRAASLAVGDIDRDGDTDFMVLGSTLSVSQLSCVYYENTNGVFSAKAFPMIEGTDTIGVYDGNIKLNDVNNSGTIDFVVMGRSFPGNRFQTYTNVGSASFNPTQNPLGTGNGVSNGGIALADYNNDGKTDLVVTGSLNGTSTKVLKLFTENSVTSAIYQFDQDLLGTGYGYDYSDAAWGDIDKDGDLDLVVMGIDNNGAPKLVVFKNKGIENGLPGNDYPSIGSANLSEDYDFATKSLKLKWPAADVLDSGVTFTGASYALRVGTVSGSSNVVSGCYGTPLNGTHLCAAAEGTYKYLLLKNILPDTTYYWSASVIDAGLTRSNWTVEKSTFVPDIYPPAAVSDFNAYPDTQDGAVYTTWAYTGDDGNYGSLTNAKYRILLSSVSNSTLVQRFELSNELYLIGTGGQTVGGLTPGVTYYLGVQLRDNTGNWSALSNVATTYAKGYLVPNTAPAAITSLAAVPAYQKGVSTLGTVSLEWTNTGENGYIGNLNSAKYKIYFSTSSSPLTSSYLSASMNIAAGTNLLHNLTGLIIGGTYYFSVTLIDSIGQESATDAVATCYANGFFDDTPPAAVTDLVVANRDGGAGSIMLNWTNTGDNGYTGNLDDSKYRITYSSFTQAGTEIFMSYITDRLAGSRDGHQVIGLIPGVSYYFYINLIDKNGMVSANSNIVYDYASGYHDVTPPAAVTDLNAVQGYQEGSIDLIWTSVGDDGFSGDISMGFFRITYSKYPDTTGVGITKSIPYGPILPGYQYRQLITSLQAGVTYYLKLVTIDDVGLVSDTAATSAFAALSATQAPKPVLPSQIYGVGTSTCQISWQWNNDGQYYEGVRIHAVSGGNPVIATITAGTTFWIENISGYSGFVRTFEFYNTDYSTTSVSVYGYPLAPIPVNVQLVTKTAGTVTLLWDGIAEKYAVLYSTISETAGPWNFGADWNTNVFNRSYTVSGLKSNTTYWLRVAAYNGSQVLSQHSSPIQVLTDKFVGPAPVLTTISPVKGANTGTIALIVTGSNLSQDIAVSLSGPLAATAPRVSQEFISVNSIRATFNLQGLTTGLYTVEVVDPEQRKATLADAFTVYYVPVVNTTLETTVRAPADNMTSVVIPQNAFDSSNVFVRFNPNPVLQPETVQPVDVVSANTIVDSISSFKRLTGSTREVAIYRSSDNVLIQTFVTPVTLSIPYEDINNDGVIDSMAISRMASVSSVYANNLKMYRLVSAQWQEVAGANVDTLNKVVRANVYNSGVYVLIAKSVTGDVNRVNVGRNVFVPSAAQSCKIYFTVKNSDSYVNVKIFDISGNLVDELVPKTKASDLSTNSVDWDGYDRNNAVVSPGVYIAVLNVSGNENETKTARVYVAQSLK